MRIRSEPFCSYSRSIVVWLAWLLAAASPSGAQPTVIDPVIPETDFRAWAQQGFGTTVINYNPCIPQNICGETYVNDYAPRICQGGTNDGQYCIDSGDCDGETCDYGGACLGGSNNLGACSSDGDCDGGFCRDFRNIDVCDGGEPYAGARAPWLGAGGGVCHPFKYSEVDGRAELVTHAQAAIRLPDGNNGSCTGSEEPYDCCTGEETGTCDTNAYFAVSASDDEFGGWYVIEVKGGVQDPSRPEIVVSPTQAPLLTGPLWEDASARMVWLKMLNDCWSSDGTRFDDPLQISDCYHPKNEGNYNHPARFALVGEWLFIAYQNFQNCVASTCRPELPWPRALDALALFDVSDPRRPQFVRKFVVNKDQWGSGEAPPLTYNGISEISVTQRLDTSTPDPNDYEYVIVTGDAWVNAFTLDSFQQILDLESVRSTSDFYDTATSTPVFRLENNPDHLGTGVPHPGGIQASKFGLYGARDRNGDPVHLAHWKNGNEFYQLGGLAVFDLQFDEIATSESTDDDTHVSHRYSTMAISDTPSQASLWAQEGCDTSAGWSARPNGQGNLVCSTADSREAPTLIVFHGSDEDLSYEITPLATPSTSSSFGAFDGTRAQDASIYFNPYTQNVNLGLGWVADSPAPPAPEAEWIEMTFPRSFPISRVALHDLGEPGQDVHEGRLRFYRDGSPVGGDLAVPDLSVIGDMFEVPVTPPREADRVRFIIDDATLYPGLQEMRVYASCAEEDGGDACPPVVEVSSTNASTIYTAARLVDGISNTEWFSDGEGGDDDGVDPFEGAWADFEWRNPVDVQRVVLTDRWIPAGNTADHVQAVTLRWGTDRTDRSNVTGCTYVGTSLLDTPLFNVGNPVSVDLSERVEGVDCSMAGGGQPADGIEWMELRVNEVVGPNAGLAEVEFVYGSAPAVEFGGDPDAFDNNVVHFGFEFDVNQPSELTHLGRVDWNDLWQANGGSVEVGLYQEFGSTMRLIAEATVSGASESNPVNADGVSWANAVARFEPVSFPVTLLPGYRYALASPGQNEAASFSTAGSDDRIPAPEITWTDAFRVIGVDAGQTELFSPWLPPEESSGCNYLLETCVQKNSAWRSGFFGPNLKIDATSRGDALNVRAEVVPAGEPLVPGQTVTFEVEVENTSGLFFRWVQLEAEFDANFSPTGVISGCDGFGPDMSTTCRWILLPGASETVQIHAILDPAALGQVEAAFTAGHLPGYYGSNLPPARYLLPGEVLEGVTYTPEPGLPSALVFGSLVVGAFGRSRKRRDASGCSADRRMQFRL
jgi:hypothetical protein